MSYITSYVLCLNESYVLQYHPFQTNMPQLANLHPHPLPPFDRPRKQQLKNVKENVLLLFLQNLTYNIAKS